MFRLPAACAGLLMLASPAQAQLTDARLGGSGPARELWLAFDSQPEAVRAVEGPDGRIFEIDGVSSPARVIDVAISGALERIALAPEDADTVRLTLTGALLDPHAQLRQGGVLIRFEAAEPVQEAPAEVAQAPTRAPRERGREDSSPVPPQADAPPGAEVRPDEAAGPCAQTQARIAQSPWDLDALTDHAACLTEDGLTDQAIGLYERVLAFEPGHYAAAMGLARLREARGQNEAARDLFLEAARNARTDGEALQARAAARRMEEG